MKIGPFSVRICMLPAVFAIAPLASAWAAPPVVPYGIGNAVQNAEQARRAAPKPPHGTPVLPQLVEPQFTLKGKETLLVRHFIIEGDEIKGDRADKKEVRAILAAYEGRKLTLAQIYEAADKVTTHYRDKGYLVAKVYVPIQDARKGTLRLKLLLGRYGRIKLNNESLVRTGFLQGIIDHAVGTGAAAPPPIHKNELERAMLLISDLAGAGVPKVAIGAGQQQGLSDFAFTLPPARRINGFVLGDNFGTPWTGRDRLTGGLDINSPLGLGDQLSLFGMVSKENEMIDGSASYSLPIGYDGLRAQVTAFHTTYVLGGTFASLDSRGVADGISGTLTYPIIRSRAASLYIAANFSDKVLNDLSDNLSYADRTIKLGTLSLSYNTIGLLPFTGLPMTTNTIVSFTIGNVYFFDPTQRSENIAGADTVGNYGRINLTFSDVVALTDKLSASVNARAQKASRNLDTSEQLQLTGAYGIRSFNEGVSGDSGYIITPELRYALPTLPRLKGFQHSIGLFTDVGGAWLEDGSYTVTQQSFTQLNDVGIGYYASYEYSPGRLLLVKAMGARTYGSDGKEASYDQGTKGLVQVGVTF
jgi:hemolysin activation/secretion protein